MHKCCSCGSANNPKTRCRGYSRNCSTVRFHALSKRTLRPHPIRRVRAFGPGIEPLGPVVDAPANFTVETFSAGRGTVDVTVQSPDGSAAPADVRFNNDAQLTFSASYVPKMEGPHKVFVKFSGRDIAKSPYTVQVAAAAGDASKVVASGPGLLADGVCAGRPTFFEINSKSE